MRIWTKRKKTDVTIEYGYVAYPGPNYYYRQQARRQLEDSMKHYRALVGAMRLKVWG